MTQDTQLQAKLYLELSGITRDDNFITSFSTMGLEWILTRQSLQ